MEKEVHLEEERIGQPSKMGLYYQQQRSDNYCSNVATCAEI